MYWTMLVSHRLTFHIYYIRHTWYGYLETSGMAERQYKCVPPKEDFHALQQAITLLLIIPF